MSLAAIILCGGASTRMGRPKALLPAPGGAETFLDRLIGILAAHCAPVIVVLGHDAGPIRAGLARQSEAMFVVNPNYRRGQFSSLQCGLAAVPVEAAGALFTPVDLPLVLPETIARLAEASKNTPDCLPPAPVLLIPRYQGRHGHPVCCFRELIPEFLNLPDGAQARDVIHRHTARTCYVDVDDPGILRDVDDPLAYHSLPGCAESR